MVIIGTYFLHFHAGLSDRQDIWGVFGNYMGGTVGPILSFAALIILVKTLQYQRKEWEDARRQARIDRLLDFAKHVYGEFDKLLDEEIKLQIKAEFAALTQISQSGGGKPNRLDFDHLEDRPIRQLFNFDSLGFPFNIADKDSLEELKRPDGVSEWDRHYHIHVGKLTKLIIELNGILRAIKAETDSEDATSFYVNRCRPVTCALGIKGYIPLVKMSLICPFQTIENYSGKWTRVKGKFVKEA